MKADKKETKRAGGEFVTYTGWKYTKENQRRKTTT